MTKKHMKAATRTRESAEHANPVAQSPVAAFLDEVQRRGQKINLALTNNDLIDRTDAFFNLGNIADAESLVPFVSPLRKIVSDQNVHSAITNVCDALGNCVALAITEMPHFMSPVWRAAYGNLNQAIHALKSWGELSPAGASADGQIQLAEIKGDAPATVDKAKRNYTANGDALIASYLLFHHDKPDGFVTDPVSYSDIEKGTKCSRGKVNKFFRDHGGNERYRAMCRPTDSAESQIRGWLESLINEGQAKTGEGSMPCDGVVHDNIAEIDERLDQNSNWASYGGRDDD